ncbi:MULTISPECIES: hypothetical protein [Methylosinus]|uniref:Uncharacterized protein n=1 Tax=Methylosinus trichosporium (strain ATCC 35070 / NCIMB 11131 / UNIQEM 75 / OB3b) TaxID=595536 RepID=A0A2D2CXA9_METT3|nr:MULTISPECIES: hypothetical protein [Methylosinus]ATQ67365.1 hypothetical protein CQW49_05250 [Methylosinus trichosporium OB3b]OBS51622.1 hypothetical protein A8B73_15540 [Methylosinus sp. 3S-1]
MKAHSTRRTILAGLAATPIAGLPALAAGGELATLIARHSSAGEIFGAAYDELDRVERAWFKSEHGFTIPIFIGGSAGSENGPDEVREFIAGAYRHNREALERLACIEPELAEQMRRALDAKEAENLAMAGALFAEEDERKEAFGLGPALRRYHEAEEAEEEAALALCSYRCRSLEEARIKAAAILESAIADEFRNKFCVAFLESFLEAGA